MDMTREETLNRLYDIQRQMMDMQTLLQNRIRLEQTYQKRKGYIDLQEHQDHQAGIGTKKVIDKGKLLFMVLMCTCMLFSLLIDLLLALLYGEFDYVPYLILALCAAVVIKYRGQKRLKRKYLALAVLVGYTILEFQAMWKSITTTPYEVDRQIMGTALVIALVLALLASLVVVAVVNRVTARRNREIDAYNQSVDARNRDYVAQVDAENARIIEQNKQTRAKCAEMDRQYDIMAQNLANSCTGWYPPDYCDLASVQFFIDAFRNYKADTIGEAVRLYDESQYRQSVLAAQAQQSAQLNRIIYGQQELGQLLHTTNMLQVGRMIQSSIQTAHLENTIRSEAASVRASIPHYY